jgi:predicted acetyltransferase
MAMAFINPWKLHIEDKIEDIYFLEGVCTHQDYQRCGLMKKLISYIMKEYKDKHLALQAYNWDLYRKFGFKETHYLHSYTLNTIKCTSIVCNKLDPSTMVSIYNQYVQDKDGYRIHDISYYTDFFIPYIKACEMKIKQYHTQGYVVYYEDSEEIIVRYIHYINEEAYHNMLYTLLKEYNKPLLIYSHKGDTPQIALMMYPYRKIDAAYVNEII